MDNIVTTPGEMRGANSFNVAYKVVELLAEQLRPAMFLDVDSIEVSEAVMPSASGQSAAFRMVMVGRELNGSNPDKRRIFTIRVSQETTF